MGADDADECSPNGHEWALVEVTAGPGGAHVEKACTECGAVTLVGPDELGGWV